MRRFLIAISSVLMSVCAFAQQPQRNVDPTLNPGQGLTMTQKQVESMRGDGQNKRTEQKDIYLFGVTFSQIDSTIYVSDLQPMQQMIVSNGCFLYSRTDLEQQLQDWVLNSTGIASPLTTVYFHEKEKRMERKRTRLIRKLKKKGIYQFLQPTGSFQFIDQ